MRILNALPLFLERMKAWETLPSPERLRREYIEPVEEWLAPLLEDFGVRSGAGLHEVAEELDWAEYRADVLRMDPGFEEARVRRHLEGVERFFGLKLEGEVVLFGAFTAMDGYARFDRGTHRVFLGVDESHGRGAYLDVLISHELTHVARESRPEVWTGFGLDPKMSHDDFTEAQPVIEHLFSEGFSCAVSEILVPGQPAWAYAYQEEEGLREIFAQRAAVDRVIHAELRKRNGSYGRLYDGSRYGTGLPVYTHYVWAWQWVKHLIREHGHGSAAKLLARCSGEFLDDALAFRLPERPA